MRQGKSLATGEAATRKKTQDSVQSSENPPPASGRKLSYKLQRELDQLPEVIDSVEKGIERLRGQTLAPGFYEQSFADTQPVLDQLSDLESELEQHLARWSELEDMANRLRGNA